MKKAIIFTRVSSDRQHLEEQESRANMSQEEKYWLVHEAINSIELEISGEFKTVTLYSSNSERTAKFRFSGQARYFRLVQIIDDEEIDVTNVAGYK